MVASPAPPSGVILVDGSNALPALGADRLSDDARRMLVRSVASLARARRTKAVVVFDGNPGAAFATSLGAVSVRFSGSSSGDDLIVSIVASKPGRWTVITRDAGLKARLAARRVSFEEPAVLHETPDPDTSAEGDDWESWFDDPSNRIS